MLPCKTAGGEPAFLPVAGGAACNTAIALGRLGVPAGLMTGLSHDRFGQFLESRLAEAEVDVRYCVRSDNPTTLAFVHLEDGSARYQFFDENSAGKNLTVDDLPELPAEITALLLGGISLLQEPCGTSFEQLVSDRPEQVITMLDLNIRPDFVTDETGYRARLDRMVSMSDIVKASSEDLAWLYPDRAFRNWADDCLQQGAAAVLLTDGASGSRVVTAKADIEVPGKACRVADTVGAGDTFNAGFLASLLSEGVLTRDGLATAVAGQLTEALQFSAKAAAVSVGRSGADPPWAHEL